MLVDLILGSIHSPTVDSSNTYNFYVVGHPPDDGFCKTQSCNAVNANVVNC
jgi:hypothetical protein